MGLALLVGRPPAAKVSIMQNYIEQRAVDLQAPVVVNETQFPEPVHEKADSRTGRSNHLGQGLLTDLGNHGFRLTIFAEMSEQKKDAGQSLFTGIKQLVDQVFFVTDI